jgi:hypothetical protein
MLVERPTNSEETQVLNTKIRTKLAVLGTALTVLISTAATIAPNAYAQKNRGCNQACQLAIANCAQLQSGYNNDVNLIGYFSRIGEYAMSVNEAFAATNLHNAARGDGCAWAA